MERSGMWGHKNDTVKDVLKGRPNIYRIINHRLYLYRSFRTPSGRPFRKPDVPLRFTSG
ncbi:hypothetical protein Barb4_02592 [Bacteroidales bacterium Barb4]|nr:hypothetical protein Barb4_02592 [Bacteroidales bacterium Barb4]